MYIFCAISENRLQKKDPHLFEATYPGKRKKIFAPSEFIFVNNYWGADNLIIIIKYLYIKYANSLMNSIKLFAYSTKYFARLRKIDFKKRSPIFSRLYILGAGKKFSSSQNLFSLILRCWQFDHNYKIFIHKQCKFTNEFNKIIWIYFARSRKIDFKKRTPIFSRLYILGTGKHLCRIMWPKKNIFYQKQ